MLVFIVGERVAKRSLGAEEGRLGEDAQTLCTRSGLDFKSAVRSRLAQGDDFR